MASPEPGMSFDVTPPKIAVIGLGYVGLPVAVAFARAGQPGGRVRYRSQARIRELNAGQDRTREVEAADLKHPSLRLYHARTADSELAIFSSSRFQPRSTSARRPDLGAMFEASRMVGAALKKGDIVVYESTVYPGRGRRRMRADPRAMFGLEGRRRISTSGIRRSASIPATSSIVLRRS